MADPVVLVNFSVVKQKLSPVHLRDYISDAARAEELGFVRAWFGEHHFRPRQWTGSPIQVCTAVAARTERLRVGTAVALLPSHDPIRMAEDVAICDTLSRGRFDFGFGRGSQYEERTPEVHHSMRLFADEAAPALHELAAS